MPYAPDPTGSIGSKPGVSPPYRIRRRGGPAATCRAAPGASSRQVKIRAPPRGWEGPGRKNPAIFRELPGKRPAIVPEGLVHTRRAWPGACAARLDLPRPSPSPVCLISGSPPFRPGKPAIREFPAVSLTGYGGLAPAIVGTAGKLTRRIDCFDECGKKVPDPGKEFKKISAAHGSSPIDFSLTLLIQNIQCFLAVKVFERH